MDEKKKVDVVTVLIALVFSALMSYWLTAFVVLDANALTWHPLARLGFIVLTILLVVQGNKGKI